MDDARDDIELICVRFLAADVPGLGSSLSLVDRMRKAWFHGILILHGWTDSVSFVTAIVTSASNVSSWDPRRGGILRAAAQTSSLLDARRRRVLLS